MIFVVKRLTETTSTLRKNKEKWLKYYLTMLKRAYPTKTYTWIAKKTREIAMGKELSDFRPWTALFNSMHFKGMGQEQKKGFAGELKALAISNISLLTKLAKEKDTEDEDHT